MHHKTIVAKLIHSKGAGKLGIQTGDPEVSDGGSRSGAGAKDHALSRSRAPDGVFLVELGQRVRRMRALRGMSRKMLSRVSGVSERYIAELESGRGNPSITLLRRVAAATGGALEDLVGEPSSQAQEWVLMRELMRRASPEAMRAAKAVLSVARPKPEPDRGECGALVARVALIGLRGAGKSTLGRLGAERLGWKFIELNKEIERETGLSIAEVFSLYGQEGYRRLELAALEQVLARTGPMILATAGGIVAEPVTFELLRSSCFTVWVKAKPAEHMSRVREQGDLRPMADGKAAMAELMTILSSREPLYARADAVVDTSKKDVETSVSELLAIIAMQTVAIRS
ncbi:MAG: helix-turn-helix transcriptional regulator [Hyphomicrobiales bacterium]|nr:helix-turn-helix transcriptional regulator [Hyphomicrobiales bacterium]MBV9433699.1 helix-turn-helix transcriptional regulator [Hyphomicrobiales bacterium]